MKGDSQDFPWQWAHLNSDPTSPFSSERSSNASMKRTSSTGQRTSKGYPDKWGVTNKSSASLRVWRITRYNAVHWPENDYGHFYNQDAYIVLNVTSSLSPPQPHIHIWLGRQTAEEDYITAVEKASALDQFLSTRATIHREVEGKESDLFCSYFKPITVWRGSSDKSYSCLELEKRPHTARLLVFYKPDPFLDTIRVKEVPSSLLELDNTRIYLLDLGKSLIQWTGSLCKTEDVLKSVQYMERLKAARGGTINTDAINEKNDDDDDTPMTRHPFYAYLGRRSFLSATNNDEDDAEQTTTPIFPSLKKGGSSGRASRLVRITNHKGKVEFKKVKEGNISMKDIEKQPLCIFDNTRDCFLWLGHKVISAEKPQALIYAHEYLSSTSWPLIRVHVVMEGAPTPALQRALIT